MQFESFHLLILLTLSISTSLYAEDSDNVTQTFTSGSQKTHLLELYSSQGCSSCPPAERWISRLKGDSRLWSEIVPVVFHVDYWNHLGWRDPFSNAVFSQRQRQYHHQNSISSVYTPGFVLDGQEWRQWIFTLDIKLSSSAATILSAHLVNKTLTATYDSNSPLILNVALLGFNLTTDISAGENSGRHVNEDFVVLDLQSEISRNGHWSLTLPDSDIYNTTKLALAIWLHSPENITPIQTTGGWLELTSN